jgi:hypothetical protein
MFLTSQGLHFLNSFLKAIANIPFFANGFQYILDGLGFWIETSLFPILFHYGTVEVNSENI